MATSTGLAAASYHLKAISPIYAPASMIDAPLSINKYGYQTGRWDVGATSSKPMIANSTSSWFYPASPAWGEELVYAINDSFTAVGVGMSASGVAQPLVWNYLSEPASFALPPGATGAVATSVNDANEIVGYVMYGSARSLPFRASPGSSLSLLGAPAGATVTMIYGVDAAGEIVGTANGGPAGWSDAAYYTDAGGWVRLPMFPTAAAMGCGGLNAATAVRAGLVVGTSCRSVGFSVATGTIEIVQHAAMWKLGGLSPADLGALYADTTSTALALNASDEIVGQSGDGVSVWHGFLWTSGTMHDLDALLDVASAGWHVTKASSINDAGAIAAEAIYGGQTYAVQLTLD
ncbi:MAG: hypothetical protein ACHREM_10355 [Polyangiales bacterium]